MEHWTKYRFSEAIIINPTIKLSKSKSYSFIEMKDLSDGAKYTYPSISKPLTGGARFQERDTLFARITPCLENGKICQARDLEDEVGFGSTEFLVFRGRPGITDTDFVFYLSRSPEVRQFAEQHLVGTSGRQRVGREAFDNLFVTLPPIIEQRRIATILSSLDDKIELNRRMNQTLEHLAQTLFRQWFVAFDFPNADGQPYCSSGGEMIESELGDIPRGWRVARLKEVAGINAQTLNPKKAPKAIRYIDIASVNTGRVDEISYLAFSEAPSRARRIIKEGDVVWSTVRPNRRAFFLALNIEPDTVVSTGFAVLSPTNIPYSFLYLLSTTEEFTQYLVSNATGSAYPAVNSSVFANAELVIPAKEVLSRFDSIVGPLLQRANHNDNQSRTLVNLRDTLLPQLLSGRITVHQAEELVG